MANNIDLSISLADKLSGPALKAAQSLGKLEAALKKQRSIGSDAVGVSPIIPVGAPSASHAKASKAEDKAKAAAEKAALRQQAATQKAADKARIAEEKATAKAIEKIAKDEARDRDKAAKDAKKADDKAAKDREKAAKAAAKKAKDAYNSSNLGAFSNAFKDGSQSTSVVESLGGALGELVNPATLAAVAVAGLSAVFATVVIGGSALALQATEAKRDALNTLEAFLGSAKAAGEFYDSIGDIQDRVAISQDRAIDLAKQLSASGITQTGALRDAITSIGQVESVLGDAAGGKIQKVLEKAAQSGKFQISAKQLVGTGVQLQSLYAEIGQRMKIGTKQVEAQLKAGKVSAEVGIAALTKTLDTKFAGAASDKVNTLANQFQRFRDNVSKIFADIDTGPFLAALKTVFDLFDQDSSTGQALHDIVTSIFDSIFSIAAKAVPYVRIAFKTLILIGLNIYNAFRPVFAQFGLFQDSSSDADGFASAMLSVANGVGVVAGWFAKLASYQPLWTGLEVVFGAVAIAIGVAVAAGAALLAINYALVAGVITLVGWLTNLATAAISAGANLVTGLVQGIKNGAGFLVDAVKGMATSAINAFKSVFKIHSPSRVMMGLGDNISLGLAHGIDLGAPAVNDSLTGAVDTHAIAPPRVAATLGSLSASQGQAPNSAGGKTITIQSGAVQLNLSGIGSVEELKSLLPQLMGDAVEQLALQLGEKAA